MSNTVHPAQLAGQLSLKHTGAGDKDAWLGLFADDAVVQDPVGKSPFDPEGKGHIGIAAIGRFWDMTRSFGSTVGEIHESFPAENSCANVITLTTTLKNGDVSKCKNVTVYTTNAQGKLSSLKAYWTFGD